MTIKEIKEMIGTLNKDEKAEIFSEKNRKLSSKDKEISDLNEKLKTFEEKAVLDKHKESLADIFTKSNIKKEYFDAVNVLSGIQVGDEKNVIQTKIKSIKENNIYKNMFNGIGSTVNTTFNNGLSDKGMGDKTPKTPSKNGSPNTINPNDSGFDNDGNKTAFI